MRRVIFPVTSHEKKFATVDVRVYPTREAMVQSVRRHHKLYAGGMKEPVWYSRMTACCSPISSQNEGERSWHHRAIIRLVEGNCGATIVSHEATHAALYFYREQIQQTIPDMEREEIFCHLVSEIVGEINHRFYDIGVYP